MARGGVFNVGTGEATSLNQLVERSAAVLGCERTQRHEPERVGDLRHSRADVTHAREVLEFEAELSLTEGLARTLPHYLD